MIEFTKNLIWTISFLIASNACADFSVIVHPDNTSEISQKDIANLFLGKVTKFSNGLNSLPVNQKSGCAARDTFDQTVLKKNPSQMKSYWSHMVFTGKAIPIRNLENDADVIEFVSSNTNAIGYIDSSSVNDSVKVLLSFDSTP